VAERGWLRVLVAVAFAVAAVPVGAGLWWLDASRLDPAALGAARAWLDAHPAAISSADHVLVIDFNQPSFVERAHLVTLSTGEVRSYTVTHGKNSGWAWVERLSNVPESYTSSAGAFRTGEVYVGDHGRSLRLHGLEPGVNDAAYDRQIVMHAADYARLSSVLDNGGRLGRSLGCPAFAPEDWPVVLDALGTGSLVYAHWTL
jgi:hypothetical protein